MIRSLICFFMLVLCLWTPEESLAQVKERMQRPMTKLLYKQSSPGSFEFRLNNLAEGRSPNIRMTAIALNLTLGVFGMHRLYLGTDVKVPVFYTLTLGGGFVLWAADLGCLIFTKDISRYYNNPHLFMWNPKEEVLNP